MRHPERNTMTTTDHRPMRDLMDARWARRGEYGLSQEAASVFWYLHGHGVWEPGHPWLGYADFRMTMNSFIQSATSLDEDSVRRGLGELEEKGFIRRTPWFWKNGMQSNDSIEFTVPHDWCPDCHERGDRNHVCDPGPCLCGLGREQEMNDMLLGIKERAIPLR
jgi:hypothetical protein